MAALLSVIQFYPALNKMVTDLSGLWTGADPAARERILQHKMDEARQQLVELKILIERTCGPPRLQRDASTQTDPQSTIGPSDHRGSPQLDDLIITNERYITSAPETPRDWASVVTGVSR